MKRWSGRVAASTLAILLACSRRRASPADAAPPAPAPAPESVSVAGVPRPSVSLGRIGDGRTGSSVALARWADRVVAFVADEDDAAIRAIDLDAREELAATPLGSRPSQLLVAGDGRLLVALRDE